MWIYVVWRKGRTSLISLKTREISFYKLEQNSVTEEKTEDIMME